MNMIDILIIHFSILTQEIREREERKLDVLETNADDIQQQQVTLHTYIHQL